MTIRILETDFNAAAGLIQLLERRRIAVLRKADAGTAAAALVLSARHAGDLGGAKGMADIARTFGAKMIVVVEENAPAFAMLPEMGGRLIRIALPAAHGVAAVQDSGLLMLADVLGQQVSGMVAADPLTGQLIDLARRVANTDVTVFINGPTGSGKEVLARFIHASSRRASQPFVAINCAAIPENMLEAILFGHEKGAFTGAATANKGLIRAADGGTLMLDEVSEMPMGLQSKLLRVLQERVVTPIGTQTEVPVNIRVIATSNRDMPAEVRAQRFREDLFYRLNVFPLATRALAERRGDIPALATALVRRHTQKDETPAQLAPETLTLLSAHSWPGNVRELENVIQRALVLRMGPVIQPEDIILDDGHGIGALMLAQAV